MAIDLKKFLERFVSEAREHLGRLEAGLTNPGAGDLHGEPLNALFRAAHTIKGSARMLKLMGIAETAHPLEDVLGALREGRIQSTPPLLALLLRAVDALSVLVDQVEATQAPPGPADSELCTALTQAATGAPITITTPIPAAAIVANDPVPITEFNAPDFQHPPPAPDQVRVRLEKLDTLIKLMGELVSSQTKFRYQLHTIRVIDSTFQTLVNTSSTPLDSAFTTLITTLHRFTQSLRDLVTEHELLTQELNERTLIMRLLPLATVFDPLSRVARELGRSLGKELECTVSGGEIELDRHIIDRLSDALVHLLRNAIDHGLETPPERLAAGKAAQGQLWVLARQEGAGVSIEVGDDGRGLNRSRILAKAIQKGLIEAAQAAELSDDKIIELIFQPGFSTSGIITELSGRGVGLDVVKRAIADELHGAVSVVSRPGAGTHLILKLPLTLAVMRVVLFQATGRNFGLTVQHVVELIRVPQSNTLMVANRPVVILRNEFVPLIPLADLLQLAAAATVTVKPRQSMETTPLVIVIGVRQAKLGLVVDALIDERDMVIKPLPEHLRGSGLVGGLVVTGRNELVCVLQAPALLEAARRLRGEALTQAARARPLETRERHILVVDDSLNTREIERDVLEAHGYRVTLAEDGLEGWQKAVGGHFDAILTDVEMPGLDGFSLTAKLRENARYHATPIIIITSRQKEEDKQRGIQVGADAYIVKGDFDQSSLVDTLKNLLG